MKWNNPLNKYAKQPHYFRRPEFAKHNYHWINSPTGQLVLCGIIVLTIGVLYNV